MSPPFMRHFVRPEQLRSSGMFAVAELGKMQEAVEGLTMSARDAGYVDLRDVQLVVEQVLKEQQAVRDVGAGVPHARGASQTERGAE